MNFNHFRFLNHQVDLDLSIPFISIPLSHSKEADGDVKPLVNINLKSIAFAAIFAGITAFIIPLFIQSPSENRYRKSKFNYI